MYAEHKLFPKLTDQNAKLWRYMDFTKFVSMLESSSLYFARGDQFDDQYEGMAAKQNLAAWDEIVSNGSQTHVFLREGQSTYLRCPRKVH
jgi:hypothetical protein